MRDFPVSDRFERNNRSFVETNKMPGPNALKLIEVLCENMDLKPGMKILDMGCGTGLTSIFLAKEYDVTVFANDLWISATDNYQRFVEMKVDDRVFPIRAEAHSLPYADGFFDAAISIDAYHYFGTDELYLPNYYARLVKKDGQFGVVSPCLTREFEGELPEKMKKLWENDMYTFHSPPWWRHLWEKTKLVEVKKCELIEGGKDLWRATADFELHEADEENYLSLFIMAAIRI
jgi:cyclopropane fatty-acyl-phospholipid synthase-like methyltransferase